MVSSQRGSSVDRRTVIRGAGALAVTGFLAGCGGDGGDSGNEDTPTATPTATDTPTDTATEQPAGGPAPQEVEEFVSASSNYDGLVDMTGQDTVTVGVGVAGNGGNFAFGPAAVKVSTGTTVKWKWTGKGAGHNVVAEDGTFDSGTALTEAGVHFEYTFEETGTYLYSCIPHKALGMKAAVVVE